MEIENKVVVIVTIIGSIILGTYILAAITFGWELSSNPLDWGPLGDYLGGILNPIIALAALFILIMATKHQKAEFKATRSHLEKEAKKNEIYRLITSVEKKIEEKLEVEVKNDSSKPTITFGPLYQYLKPGWHPPPYTYISLGNSSLCTSIKDYSIEINYLLTNLEGLLDEYDLVDEGKLSIVSRQLTKIYEETKQACQEQITRE